MKYQIETGGIRKEVEKKAGSFRMEGAEIEHEFHAFTQEEAVVRIGQEMFTVRLIELSEDRKSAIAMVNGKKTEISIKSETDLILEKLGGGNASRISAGKIKAPMPGLIVKILVTPGEVVEKGQVLLNFEAMKMENQLKAPGPGTLKSVLVSEGDKVEKGQLLLEFE